MSATLAPKISRTCSRVTSVSSNGVVQDAGNDDFLVVPGPRQHEADAVGVGDVRDVGPLSELIPMCTGSDLDRGVEQAHVSPHSKVTPYSTNRRSRRPMSPCTATRNADDTRGAARGDRRKLATQIGGRFTARFFRSPPGVSPRRSAPGGSLRGAAGDAGRVRCPCLPAGSGHLADETKDGGGQPASASVASPVFATLRSLHRPAKRWKHLRGSRPTLHRSACTEPRAAGARFGFEHGT